MRTPRAALLGIVFLLAAPSAKAQVPCTDCHRPGAGGPLPHDTGCRNTTCLESCHPTKLTYLNHPSGPATPITGERTSVCNTCHNRPFPGVYHPYTINASAVVTPAGSVDLNLACGQCHGGGSANKSTTGSIAAGEKTLSVADPTSFTNGDAVSVAGAALVAGQPALFTTSVASVAGNVVTLVDPAGVTVVNAAVVLNPARSSAAWFSKSTLVGYAAGMHPDKPNVRFNFTYGATGLDFDVDASGTTCNGSNASCTAYDWDWGDSTTHGSDRTASHHYAAAGDYVITLAVKQYGVGTGTATQRITAYAADQKPVADGSCTIDYTTWKASCTNSSTDDRGVTQIVIDWGDGSVLTSVMGNPPAAGPYTYTFLVPGAYGIKIKAFDAAGQFSTRTLATTSAASFIYSSASGKVLQRGGATGMGAATVQIRKNGVLVKGAMTAADGSYTSGSMKPGIYVISASKTGYTFTPATLTVTIGPSAVNQNFTAN